MTTEDVALMSGDHAALSRTVCLHLGSKCNCLAQSWKSMQSTIAIEVLWMKAKKGS